MKFRKLIYVLFATIALIFTACDNSISDFLNKWTNLTPPENAKNDIQEVDVEEKSEKDYSYIVLLNPENYNENVLLRYNKIYVSKEAETAAKGCFCTYLPDDTGVTQVLYSTNISCNDEIDEEGFFTVADSSITFKVADDNVNTVRNYGLVFKYKGLSVNKVYLVEEGSSGDNGGGNGGDNSKSSSSAHMSLYTSNDGIRVKISSYGLDVQDLSVQDVETQTSFAIDINYLKQMGELEFVFPFCVANKEMHLKLSGNVKNYGENTTYWLWEEAYITPTDGYGLLDYSLLDKIELLYSEEGDTGRYLSIKNFDVNTIVSAFMNLALPSETSFIRFESEYTLIKGKIDWSDTVWYTGVTNDLQYLKESPYNLTYRLLNGDFVNILDSRLWWIDDSYSPGKINEELSEKESLWFAFKIKFLLNGDFVPCIYQNGEIIYAGNFYTKEIKSAESKYTPAKINDDEPLFTPGGDAGEHIMWELKDNVLTFTGSDNVWGYEKSEDAPWSGYKYSEIVFDDRITLIANGFENNQNLTSVHLSSSLKSILGYAFKDCKNLCEITLPSGLREIKEYAFYGCGITEFNIPASVTYISENAFSEGTVLKVEWTESEAWNHNINKSDSYQIHYKPEEPEGGIISENISWEIADDILYIYGNGEIPDYDGTLDNSAPWFWKNYSKIVISEGITKIGKYAFLRNGNMPVASVTIPASVKIIGAYAFYCNSLKEIYFENNSNCEVIGDYAFDSTEIEKLTIPASVKSIGANAFSYCSSLKELDFENKSNCEVIGDYAFYSTGIEKLTIPASVETIGSSAFFNSTLTEVIFEEGSNCRTIGSRAFESCNIPSVTIPASVEFIGENAFSYNTEVYVDWYESESDKHNVGLSNVIYRVNDVFTFSDDGVLTIDCDVNKNFLSENNITPTSVKKLVIGKNVSVIGKETFKNCSKLKEITCSDSECSLKEVGSCAFYLTDSLEKVDLSACSKLTVIGAGAFYETRSLTEVYLPSSVEEISANAFQNCVNLETLNLNACTNLKLINDRAFENCSSLKSVTFHGNITKVGEYAFSVCTSLETADLTECVNLETLGCSVFNGCSKLKAADLSNCTKITYIDAGMFYNCTSLASVALPSTVTSLDNSSVFQNCAFTEVDLSNCSSLTALSGAFCDCSKLTRIVLPESITSFANNEFSGCTKLAEVDFSRCTNLTTIGESAFSDTAITSIDLSNTAVTQISYNAFGGCSTLETVVLPEDIAKINDSAFINCTSLSSINLNSCNSINTIGSWAFSGTAITSIDLSGYTKLNTIGSYAFNNCTSLTQVVLPVRLSSISECVFSNCIALTSIDLSACSGMETLGNSVFRNCTSLTEITLPSGMETLGNSVFRNCTSLTEITLPSGIISIHDQAFQNCSALTSVNLSGCTSLETIGNYAFESCYALTPVDLSGCTSLTTIGYCAFNICHVLDYVILPPSVKSIDYGAFNYTDEIKWNCTKSEYDDTHPEQLDFSNKFSFSDTQKITINYYSNNNYFNYSDGGYNDNFSYSIEYWSTNSTEINKLPWTNSSNYKQFLGWYKEPEFKNKVSDMEELFSGEETIVNLYALVGEIYEVEPADYSIYIISEFTDTCKMKVYILPIEDGITENCNVYYGNTENGLSDYCKPDVKMGFLVGDTLTVSENTMVYSETDIRKISNFDLSLFTYENGNVEFTAMVFVPSESGSTGKFAFNIRQSQ